MANETGITFTIKPRGFFGDLKGYDHFDNRTSVSENSGATVSLDYDNGNHLDSVSIFKSSWGNSNPTVTLA